MIFNRFKTLCTALMLLATATVFSQENTPAPAGSPFSLKDCIQYALQNNTDVRKQNLAVLKTRYQIQEARAAGLPKVNASAQVLDNLILGKQLLPGDIFGQPGTVIPVTFGTQYLVPLKIEATQLLFNKQYTAGLQAAKAAEQLTQTNAAQVRESVAYNVASTYYSALLTKEQQNIVQANLDKIGQSVQVAQVQYDNKMIRRIDVDQLRVSQSNTRAELDNVQVSYTQTLDMLKILMGYPLADTLVLAGSAGVIAELPVLPANGTATNPTLLLLDQQATLKTLESKSIRAQYYPTVGLVANYGNQAQFDKLSDVNWIPSAVLGVAINVPIFDGFQKKRQLQQRDIELQTLTLDRQLVQNQLNAQYLNSIRKYRQTQQTAVNQQANLNLAQSVYDAVQNNYKNGIATLSDLINADTGLRAAQTQFLTAQLQVRISSLDVLRANGTVSSALIKN